MKLINSNRFQLPNAPGWYHLASIQDGVKEYMCFEDTKTYKVYIEEITGGAGPFFIEDDSLAQELYNHLVYWGILRIGKVSL